MPSKTEHLSSSGSSRPTDCDLYPLMPRWEASSLPHSIEGKLGKSGRWCCLSGQLLSAALLEVFCSISHSRSLEVTEAEWCGRTSASSETGCWAVVEDRWSLTERLGWVTRRSLPTLMAAISHTICHTLQAQTGGPTLLWWIKGRNCQLLHRYSCQPVSYGADGPPLFAKTHTYRSTHCLRLLPLRVTG